MKRISWRLPAVLVPGLMAFSAHGSGLTVASQDAFAAARGNAFTATADNPSAIYYNPAGITQIPGTDLSLGLYSIYLQPTFQPPATAPNHDTTYDIGKHFAAVPQVFFTHNLKGTPVTVGLGIYAPDGGSISWPQDTGFRAVALKGTATYLRVNPVIAVKLFDGLVSIGGGASLNYAQINLIQGLRPLAAPLENYFRFTGEGWAAGGNFGLLVQPCDQLSFGATARLQTDFNIDGDTRFEQQPFISYTRIPATADFNFPLTASAGVSYRPTPKWNVEIDGDYTDWSSFNTVTIRQKSAPPFPLQQDIPVNFEWQPSWDIDLGATRYFDNGWHLSAGYTYSENSVPDKYYTPLAADEDRHFFSVGVGRTGKTVDFDITYQFGYGPARTVTGSEPSSTPGFFAGQNADGKYAFISNAVLVSVGIHF